MGSDVIVSSATLICSRFNPRSPHGERPRCIPLTDAVIKVSIHAPRMGSDLRVRLRLPPQYLFQSTLPAWGATRPGNHAGFHPIVSIHAPRMGSDSVAPFCATPGALFQSTLPAWGATCVAWSTATGFPVSIHAPRMGSDADYTYTHEAILVSIHAPRMGSDLLPGLDNTTIYQFQSTLPAWGATQVSPSVGVTERFQSTLPAWGATWRIP